MANSLDVTFDYLATTPNVAALETLRAAAASRHEPIWRRAVRALMRRNDYAGHLDLLRSLDPMIPRWRAVVQNPPVAFIESLRLALQEDDIEICRNACRIAVWAELFDFIPVLAARLEATVPPHRELFGQTLMELSEMLASRLTTPPEGQRGQALQWVVGQIRNALEHHVSRFSTKTSREILEVYILVAGSDRHALTAILNAPTHPAHKALVKSLEVNTSAPVLQLLADYLADPQAPPAVLGIIGRRTDPRFLRHLLRKIGPDPNPIVRKNLKRIYQFTWLKSGMEGLDHFSEAEQRAIVQLIRYCQLRREESFRLIERMLFQGRPGARVEAAKALEDYHGAEANGLALKALEDSSPEVQAAVLPQLRRRGIPGALPRIVSKLDSPHAVVRRAARRSLAEFSFRRFLGTWDLLEPEVRRSTGMLVKKVDPHTQPMLRAELGSPMRTRRLRALAVASTLDLVPQLEMSIIPLLRDEDHIVRAEAASALALSESPQSRAALIEALKDPSPTVREAARKSLEERNELQPTGDG